MKVLDVIKDNEFINYLGIELTETDEEHITARIPFSDKLKNPYGSLHGGVLYSVADIVCGTLACMSGKFVTTVSGSMNYISPAIADEYIICEAAVVKSGVHMVFVNCTITSDTGKVLDTGSFTFYKTNVDSCN